MTVSRCRKSSTCEILCSTIRIVCRPIRWRSTLSTPWISDSESPGQRFVEQQHLGLGQDRHRDLQAPFFAQAQVLHHAVAYVFAGRRFPGSRGSSDRCAVPCRCSAEAAAMDDFRCARKKASTRLSITLRLSKVAVSWNVRINPRATRCWGVITGDVFAFVVDCPLVGREKSRSAD